WALLSLGAAGAPPRARRWHDRLEASRLLVQVEAISVAAVASGRDPCAFLPANLQALDRAAELAPADFEVPMDRGSLYLLCGSPRAAIEPYRRAAALEPHPEIYLHLGEALLQAGEAAEARQSFRLAVELNPLFAGRVPPSQALTR